MAKNKRFHLFCLDKTNIVIPLGFNDSWISSLNKKEVIVKYLKDLSYAAGSTFTGTVRKYEITFFCIVEWNT